MVGLGFVMLLVAFGSLWAWHRKRLFDPDSRLSRWVLNGWRAMTFSGFIALLAGWFVVEIGRQPYVIHGLLRTSEAISPNIQAAAVMGSLITFFVAYAIVFGAGFWYLLNLVRRGPLPQEPAPETHEGEKTPRRPLSVGNRPIEQSAGHSRGRENPAT